MDRLKQKLLHNWLGVLLSVAIAGVVGITLPALFSSRHFLFNLEPYPDGLLYLASAKALIYEQTLQVTHADWQFKTMVPPFYSLLLAVGWLIWQHPAIFYVVNVGLLVVATIFFTLVFRNMVRKPWLVMMGLVGWLLHASLVWLVGLPMAETLALALASVGLWALVRGQQTFKHLLLATMIGWLLVLTKYVYVGLAGWMLVWAIGWVIVHRRWQWLWGLICASAVGLLTFSLYQQWLGINVLEIFAVLFPRLPAASVAVSAPAARATIAFYSFSYVSANASAYLQGLLGGSTHLLWQSWPITSGLLSGTGAIGLMVGIATKQRRWMVLLLGGAFIAQWPLLLVFITMDMRYALFSIPLALMGCLLLLDILEAKKSIMSWGLAGLVVISVAWVNLPWYRTVLADNLLHRSRAWQYEAVQELGRSYNNSDVTVITALPPTLFNLYGFEKMKLLPMSTQQEFAQKKMPAWGTDVNYQDLSAEYKARLARGEKVVVTNAYITHQQVVVEDFEKIKNTYPHQLITDGCQHTCQVFELN